MAEVPLRLSRDAADWAIAIGVIALWLVLTVLTIVRRKRGAASAADAVVISASQTGHAGDLAQQAQLRLEAAGMACALLEADEVTPEIVAASRLVIFVASTTGEGEAPDNARKFERDLLSRAADLSGKQVAVLCLGDRRYRQFCGFGRKIVQWARKSGADLLFPPIEVDDLSPADLARWNEGLAAAGFPAVAGPDEATETAWQVEEHRPVAGPSRNCAGELTGEGLFRIALRPVEGALPTWEIGDLFELRTPDGHLRDYSIANLPGDGEVLLFVRRVIGDGKLGAGSGHLTGTKVGSRAIQGRIRSHRSFRPPAGQGPLLAIGAGSGWAGVRPHLLHARSHGQPCRLVFGERADADSAILPELREWQRNGRLDHLDLALSQPGGGGRYVQHVIARLGAKIPEFLGDTGRIVICGRQVMGENSLAALTALLGREWLDRARAEGRLLRDLY